MANMDVAISSSSRIRERIMASRIQTMIRGFLARLHVQRRRKTKRRRLLNPYHVTDHQSGSAMFFTRHGAARIIQRWWLNIYRILRSKRHNQLRSGVGIENYVEYLRLVVRLQAIMRRFLINLKLKTAKKTAFIEPVRVIQRVWRRTLARMRLLKLTRFQQVFLQMKYKASARLVQWASRVLLLRRQRSRRLRARQRSEDKDAGKLHYQRSIQRMGISLLWNNARQVQNLDVSFELQKLFMACSKSLGMLESSRALRLLKDCRHCLDKTLTPKLVDIIFARVKSPIEKRLDYPRFLEFLFVISCLKTFQIDSSFTSTVEDSAEATSKIGKDRNSAIFNEGINCKITPPELDKIRSFRYGALSGKAALIILFVDKYLSTNPDYIRITSTLAARSNSSLSMKAVTSARNNICGFIFSRLQLKKWDVIHSHHKIARVERHRDIAAIKLQAFRRGCLGRLTAALLAQQVYFKYGEASDKPSDQYWFNSRTGMSSWTKPKLLCKLDCGFPVIIPSDDSQFIVYCSVCEKRTMRCLCDECDELMCSPCFHRAHKAGLRKRHEAIMIPSCVRCEFQVGTKVCLKCKDAYCDTCFSADHLRGSFRTHLFTWLTDACVLCQENGAQWSHSSQSLCTPCCRTAYGDPKVKMAAKYSFNYYLLSLFTMQTTEGVERRQFVGTTVINRRIEKKQAAEKAEREALYKFKRGAIMKIDRESSALCIQRMYRGFISRKKSEPFIIKRRSFLNAKRLADKKKGEVVYVTRDLFGFAPVFETDTDRERLLKLFPLLIRKVAEDCISEEWPEAMRFYAEIKSYSSNHPQSDYVKCLIFRAQLELARLYISSTSRKMAATLKQIILLENKVRAV